MPVDISSKVFFRVIHFMKDVAQSQMPPIMSLWTSFPVQIPTFRRYTALVRRSRIGLQPTGLFAQPLPAHTPRHTVG